VASLAAAAAGFLPLVFGTDPDVRWLVIVDVHVAGVTYQHALLPRAASTALRR
jgi:hypothetical protein